MNKLLRKNYLRDVAFALFAAIFAFSTVPATILLAADPPDYLAPFDPAKGFRPAQSDLTAVFLQIAASLEFYGTPEPYLRHMKAEHERIEAKFQKQTGNNPRSFCPAYMDATYFDRLAANWKHIAPQLGLEPLAKNTGHLMQAAINGPDGRGTMLVRIFDEYQTHVYTAMSSKEPMPIPSFDVLKADIIKSARLDESISSAAGLPVEQQAVVHPANQIRAGFLKIFSALDAGLSATDAEKVKTVLVGIVDDVGRMAESEMEIGILDDSLSGSRLPQLSYDAARETRLDADEQKTFATFMKKPRFTRADFPALDKFYQGPYDRLSERGKDEMSARFWDGIQKPR